MEAIKKFIDSEASSGILLLLAAVLAIVLSNSPLAGFYERILETEILMQVGEFEFEKPALLWVNDGLMAIFFLLVGLEIKREFLAGELSSKDQIALPALAAFGGMAVPVAIYSGLNWGDSDLIRGWAIPAATDIAFALGVLALLRDRVPIALKIFLMTLAILDDLGAILVIALFYSGTLSWLYLGLSVLALAALYGLNRLGIGRPFPYVLIGALLWYLIMKSGVHATLAGVLTALFIPMKTKSGAEPLEVLETALHPYVAYFIMPVFAFANAGVSFKGFAPEVLLGGLPLGIILGLVLGKQLGITGMTWLAVRLGWAKLPEKVDFRHIAGAAFLAGIGFTMSLFIGMLAFEDQAYAPDVRFGVLSASALAGIFGYLVLRFQPGRRIT